MFPNLAFSALLFASVISALPYSNLLAVPIEPRQDPICPPTTEGQPYVARVHYYNDQGCADLASMLCLYVYQEVIDAAPGNAGCAAALIPDGPSIHARLEDTLHPNIQLAYTRDQSCPSTGAGAVFATLRNTRSCVRMSVPGSTGPGLAMFPNGGAGISRIAGVDQDRFFPNSVLSVSHTAGREALAKRRGSKCSGFRAENQMPTYSRSVQVSNIVDCINGNDSGCQITLGTERTESIATSFSTTAGGGIEGIFSVEATFGIEYTMSLTTSFSQGFTIPRGQKGYLAVYSAATLFTGKFTGCDSGDSEQAGQVVAIKKDSFTYGVILTGRKL